MNVSFCCLTVGASVRTPDEEIVASPDIAVDVATFPEPTYIFPVVNVLFINVPDVGSVSEVTPLVVNVILFDPSVRVLVPLFTPVPPLELDNIPVTPVERGNPVPFVRDPLYPVEVSKPVLGLNVNLVLATFCGRLPVLDVTHVG